MSERKFKVGDRLPIITNIESLEHLNTLMWSDFIEVVE